MSEVARKSKRVLSLLLNNPRELAERVRANLLPLFIKPESKIISLHGAQFPVDITLDPMMRHMYFQGYATAIVKILRDTLREGDTFVDIGANVGYITTYGLGLVGKTGQVHSFEPVPKYFDRLQSIQELNPGYTMQLNRFALGETHGSATIAVNNSSNIGHNSLIKDLMDESQIVDEVAVDILPFDAYVADKNMGRVSLMKIDTEGFEFPVLKGMRGFLQNAPTKPLIIAEITPSSFPFIGSTLAELDEYMTGLGYKARDIDTGKPVTLSAMTEMADILFYQ